MIPASELARLAERLPRERVQNRLLNTADKDLAVVLSAMGEADRAFLLGFVGHAKRDRLLEELGRLKRVRLGRETIDSFVARMLRHLEEEKPQKPSGGWFRPAR
jgi:hypothetical protein